MIQFQICWQIFIFIRLDEFGETESLPRDHYYEGSSFDSTVSLLAHLTDR
jgi:hypothetical protein